MSNSAIHFYEFDSFRVDVVKRRLLRGDEVVTLTPKVFDKLLALVEHGRQLISKDKLVELIWPDCFVRSSGWAHIGVPDV